MLQSFTAALMGAALGLKKPLYFISTGYGAAMALQAVTSFARYGSRMDGLSKFHCGVLTLYGVRLGTFLYQRQSLASFAPKQQATDEKLKTMELKKKTGMWLGVSVLYALMYMPCHLNSLMRFTPNATINAISTKIGAPLMFGAFLWESIADYQKQRSKTENPKTFVDTGLWKYSLLSNYFGEVAFWWGSYLTGMRAFKGPVEYVFAAWGAVGMTSIIFNEVGRRVRDMDTKYGKDKAWVERRAKVPMLFPLIGKRAT